MPFVSVPEAIEEIRAGRILVVVDDEDRENEGDLTIAAEKVTPEIINFMATHGRGLICLTLTAERCDRLAIMNEGNLVALGTPTELKSEIGGDVVLLDATHDAELLAERIRSRYHVETTVLENQVRIERQGAHRFVTEVVEAFPGEIEAISVSKPALEDVFIRRTGHKFWTEQNDAQTSAEEHSRR